MAVRQYIGARYVPKFDGAWSSTKEYEPLTIVTYLNNSYTSRKTVPVGTVPTNTAYWALTGNFNAQVEEYRQEVEEVRSTIDGYIKMTDPSPEIALLGDSAFKDVYGDIADYFTDYFNGATVTNYYQGQYNRWTTLMGQVDSITTPPDIIFIWCGSNDALPNTIAADHGGQFGAPDVWKTTYESGATTSFDAMREVIGTLRNRYPRAQIFNILRPEHPGRHPAVWHYICWFQSLIMHKWGVPVIDGNEVINLTAFNSAQQAIYCEEDGQHYSDEALERFGKRFANIINSGNPSSSGFIPPSVFFAPASLIDTNDTALSRGNRMKIANWVTEHCLSLSAGQYGGNISGVAHAYSSLGTTVVDFSGYGYLTGTENQLNNVHIFERDYEYNILGRIDNISQASEYIKTHCITSDNTVPWYNLPDGDYLARGSGISTLALPAAITGTNFMIMIRSNPAPNLDNTTPFYKYAYIFATARAENYKGYRLMSTGAESWWSSAMTPMT